MGGRHYTLCTLHAYDSWTSLEFRETWWRTTSEILRKVLKPGSFLIMGCDMNGVVGSEQSEAVGGFDADEAGGTLAHDFMREFALWAPATFASDMPTKTWSSSIGAERRIDYILLERRPNTVAIRSWVAHTGDWFSASKDHPPAVVHFQAKKG